MSKTMLITGAGRFAKAGHKDRAVQRQKRDGLVINVVEGNGSGHLTKLAWSAGWLGGACCTCRRSVSDAEFA